jgi:Polyketide cyclase / dehydrase and lipid transport
MKWLFLVAGLLVVVVGLIAAIGALLPKDHSAILSARFSKPPQAVWEVITGPPDWRSNVRSFEKLPSTDGRRTWKEIDQRGHAITYEAVEETPPARLVTRIADRTLPYGGTWTHDITPDPGGCVLTITEEGKIYNPIFRFMARFVFGYRGTIEAYMKALQSKLGQGKG